jgi:membrane protease YdiL (CAAX protease family)
MMTTGTSTSRAQWTNALSLASPVLVSLFFFLAVVALRSLDLFVLKLHTWPDPIMVSRVLGCLLVLAYLGVLQKPISSIGLHARNFDKAVLVGGISVVVLYTVLYSLAFYLRSAAGEAPRLVVGVIDNETGAIGSAFFSLFWLVGQILNALMEEAIFRGVLLPLLMRRFSFWKANLMQALLFGLAHLVFPLASWLSGETTPGAAPAGAASLLVFTTIGGLVFGYLYYRTGSLWTTVLAHVIDGIVVLFFHIQTVSTLTAERDILPLAGIGFLALGILAWIVAKRYRLPTLTPWGAD